MTLSQLSALVVVGLSIAACESRQYPATATQPAARSTDAVDPFWRSATVYFIVTDRFRNGDPGNDLAAGRTADGAELRGFLGGDIRGITDLIEDGYFSDLGVDAIWTTPLIENIHGAWEDEYGRTYAYHSYWPKDWTRVDPNLGTEADLAAMIEAAHAKGIRIIADVIANHTGPATAVDPRWPDDWVRDEPLCDWGSYLHVTDCTIVESLPDIYTERREDVELPPFLLEKWRSENRLEQEVAELDEFFERTGHPRAPRYYIIKWLTDWVRDYGIDGFRVDTAKHVEAGLWQDLRAEANLALEEWRANNADRLPDDEPFFMVGEVMDWGMLGFKSTVDGGRSFDYGDRQVDFFDHGFDSLINMGFPTHAAMDFEALFSQYADALNDGPMAGLGILNYVTSHDDQNPFDPTRSTPYEAGTKLLLAPGAAQIYYGDEVARDMTGTGSSGDAWLRTPMDWDAGASDEARALREHFGKLGRFRKAHRSVGAGVHRQITSEPYVFSRRLEDASGSDAVVVGLGLEDGEKSIDVGATFADGTALFDAYSGATARVEDGVVSIDTPHTILLLAER